VTRNAIYALVFAALLVPGHVPSAEPSSIESVRDLSSPRLSGTLLTCQRLGAFRTDRAPTRMARSNWVRGNSDVTNGTPRLAGARPSDRPHLFRWYGGNSLRDEFHFPRAS
jgi:hypothetical protein